MFIDDERFPPDDGKVWAICRSKAEVVEYVAQHGVPYFISWDHDLGEGEPTGFDIAKWLVDYDLDHNVLPKEFSYYVHSMNPVGAANINALLTNYLNFIQDRV